MAVTQEKAKEILKDGSVRGQPLTEKQKGFFGARAGGAPMPHKAKNPPMFPVPRDADQKGRPQYEEPLLGPPEAHSNVRGQGRFVGGTGHAFDGKDQFGVDPGHGAPLVDADFHDGLIAPATVDHQSPEAGK